MYEKLGGRTFTHLAGAVSYAVAQWLILTFAARMISLEAAGAYSYYLALFTPISILVSFGLRNAIASDIAHSFDDFDYWRCQLYGLLLLVVFYIGTVLVCREDALMVSLVFFIKLIEGVTEVVYGAWVRGGSAEKYGYSKIIRLTIFVPVFFAFYFAGLRNEWALYAYPLSLLISLVVYDRPNSLLNFNKHSQRKTVIQLAQVALPLAVGSFIISLNASVPRLVIGEVMGDSGVALYTILTYFAVIAAIPLVSVTQIYMPHIAALRAPLFDDVVLVALIKYTGFYALMFVVGMTLFSEYIIEIVYGIKDRYAYSEIVLVSFGGAIQFFTVIGNAILVGQRQFKSVLKVTLLGVTVSAVVIYPLTAQLLMLGACVGYFLSSVVFFLGTVWKISRLGV